MLLRRYKMRVVVWLGCCLLSMLLYVVNFMDRTVGVYDLKPLLQNGTLALPQLATVTTIGTVHDQRNRGVPARSESSPIAARIKKPSEAAKTHRL